MSLQKTCRQEQELLISSTTNTFVLNHLNERNLIILAIVLPAHYNNNNNNILGQLHGSPTKRHWCGSLTCVLRTTTESALRSCCNCNRQRYVTLSLLSTEIHVEISAMRCQFAHTISISTPTAWTWTTNNKQNSLRSSHFLLDSTLSFLVFLKFSA